MPDCFSKSEVTDFLNFMKLPDGTPVVSDGMMKYLTAYGFFTAPASTKYHGNYEGGLFEHSYAVTKFLLMLTKDNHLRWLKARSRFIVGMFHDLCKIDQYRHPVIGHIEEFNGGRTPIYDKQAWEYNPDTRLKGHGDKSVMLLSLSVLHANRGRNHVYPLPHGRFHRQVRVERLHQSRPPVPECAVDAPSRYAGKPCCGGVKYENHRTFCGAYQRSRL